MAKVAKESATLISTSGSNYVYVNRKNRRKSKGEKKLKLRKYDPVARVHILFEEKKLSKKEKAKAKKPEGAAKDSEKEGTPAAKAAA